MFIFVGMPGSGKTTFFEKKLKYKGWVHANQDILRTQKSMLNTIENALISGKSVAVDATNPTVEKRAQYIALATKYQIPTLILYFVKDGHGFNSLRTNKVPDIAYSKYYKDLVEPSFELDRVPVIEIS